MAAHKSIAENDIDIRMALLCRLYENTILIFKIIGSFRANLGRATVEMGQNLPKKGHGGAPGGPNVGEESLVLFCCSESLVLFCC
jgi:hypothetical protein